MRQRNAKRRTMTVKEIDEHELLDDGLRHLAHAMRRDAQKTRRARFHMLDFADVCLRAAGREYVEASDASEEDARDAKIAEATLELRQAAILYVYEALKACDIPLVKEWTEFDEMLRSLVSLSEDLP